MQLSEVFSPAAVLAGVPPQIATPEYGLRVGLVSSQPDGGEVMRLLTTLGALVRRFSRPEALGDELYRADLIVVDCDNAAISITDLCSALRQQYQAVRGQDLALILISREFRDESYPAARAGPVRLRRPLRNVALHLAVEALFQGRRPCLTQAAE